jgi:general stress protein YciG
VWQPAGIGSITSVCGEGGNSTTRGINKSTSFTLLVSYFSQLLPNLLSYSTSTFHNTYNTTSTKSNTPRNNELKEIAAKGGHASHGASTTSSDTPDRNPDGTFTKGSELAKELGAQGGHAAHDSTTDGASEGVSSNRYRKVGE